MTDMKPMHIAVTTIVAITVLLLSAEHFVRSHWESLKAGCSVPPERIYEGYSIKTKEYQLPACSPDQ